MMGLQYAEQPASQRSGARHSTRRSGQSAKIQCLGSYGWTDCAVANISPMGALLEVTSEVDVTRNLRVQIPQDLFEATAEVRHQNGRYICIAFTSSRPQAVRRYS